MKEDWEAMHFNFVPYKDTGISILSAIDDVQVLLDDHIVKTTTMKNSPFIGPFETEINEWDEKLVCFLFCYFFFLFLLLLVAVALSGEKYSAKI